MLLSFTSLRQVWDAVQSGNVSTDTLARLVLAPVLVLVVVYGIAAAAVHGASSSIWDVGTAIAICTTAVLLVLVLRSAQPIQTSMEMAAVPLVVGILLVDWERAAIKRMRMWPLFVALFGGLHVVGSHGAMSVSLLVASVLWVVFERVEGSARFGLYEAAYPFREPPVPEVCDCAAPPCAESPYQSFIVDLGAPWCALLFNFWLTFGFSLALARRQLVEQASTSVASKVAMLLAQYDVERGREVVKSDEGSLLPTAMSEAFEQLLDNLTNYRPYIPESLVDGGSESVLEPTSPSNAPGSGAEPRDVCICFTDVQGSSELWEAMPQAMHDALHVHDSVLRSVSLQHGGYEVKTIGDSFMLAFGSAVDACRFALEAQSALVQQMWPRELLLHPLCRRDEHGSVAVWNGLRVRGGLNWGTARVQINPTTNRCDYFGTVVNKAARVESAVVHGGLVGVTDDVMAELNASGGLAVIGMPAVGSLGPRVLKGIRGTVNVTVLVPEPLSARLVVLDARRVSTQSRAACSGGSSTSVESLGASRLGSTCSSATVTHVPSHLALALRRQEASVAVIRLCLCKGDEGLSEEIHGALAVIESYSDQTHGAVVALLSATVCVGWNAVRPCTDHVTQCACFLKQQHRSARLRTAHLGVSTGSVHSGNVSAGRRRFVTAVGACVELAIALATEAELCSEHVFACGDVGVRGSRSGCGTCVQLWEHPDTARQPLLVFALQMGGDGVMDMMLGDGEASYRHSGGERHARFIGLFSDVVHGDAEAIATVREGAKDGDSSMLQLSRLLDKGAVRVHVYPWDGTTHACCLDSVVCS